MMEDDGKGNSSAPAPSSSGTEPPRTVHCSSARDTRPIFQELTLSSNPDAVSAGSPSISRMQAPQQHLGLLPGGSRSVQPNSELESLIRSRKELIQEQLRMHLNDQGHAVAPESLRTLLRVTGCEDTGTSGGDKVSSSAVMEAIPGNGHILVKVAESWGSKSFDGGICLREVLRPGNSKMNKVESLGLFRRIVEFVHFAHRQDIVLLDLRPSYFLLYPLNKVRYVGTSAKLHVPVTVLTGDSGRKMPYEHAAGGSLSFPISNCSTLSWNDYSREAIPLIGQLLFNSSMLQLEQRWYTCPEESGSASCSIAANMYSLGVLFFELVCRFNSLEAQYAGMSCLSDRILPSRFLAENQMEAGFCFRLLHPDHASRPTTREILQSELLQKPHELKTRDVPIISYEESDDESELLLHFLVSLKAQKTNNADKLSKDIGIIEEDIGGVHKRLRPNSSSCPTNVPRIETTVARKLSQLADAYFTVKTQLKHKRSYSQGSLQRNDTNEPSSNDDASPSHIGAFFKGLCKFAQYSKIEELGSLKNANFVCCSKVIRSIDLSRDEDYFATAGISRKIKIYGVAALVDESIDIHYPMVEMLNNSKLSCVCWNRYIRNYIASTDYDGPVQIWDANTGEVVRKYAEHQKRAWAVDFCQSDPTMFASSSDDCSVKLWGLNDSNSVCTIWNPANVCCIQFFPNSAHFLAFGCADNKIYCYDMRQTRAPCITLAGHAKTVSYMKFINSENIISASTDNTLKLWNLKQKGLAGSSLADYCALTFRGHTNEKNFVGLSVWDGYIACGSETNEVFTYYKAMPAPITSLSFRPSATDAGSSNINEEGHFVSSVCWGQKNGMLLAANTAGIVKIMRMV